MDASKDDDGVRSHEDQDRVEQRVIYVKFPEQVAEFRDLVCEYVHYTMDQRP